MTDFQQFIVIRHGEGQTNATNTFQAGNQYDSDPLTPLGMEDARRLAERLTALPVDVIVTSSYLRAPQHGRCHRRGDRRFAHRSGVKGSSWVDLPANDPELRNHAFLLREIDIPSEPQELRFNDPRRERYSMRPSRSPTNPTAITPMRRTSTTCGGGQKRCAGTSRVEPNC